MWLAYGDGIFDFVISRSPRTAICVFGFSGAVGSLLGCSARTGRLFLSFCGGLSQVPRTDDRFGLFYGAIFSSPRERVPLFLRFSGAVIPDREFWQGFFRLSPPQNYQKGGSVRGFLAARHTEWKMSDPFAHAPGLRTFPRHRSAEILDPFAGALQTRRIEFLGREFEE